MKKIIILGPALPRWHEIEVIKKSLSFLENNYKLSFLDPLVDSIESPDQVTNYALWVDRIRNKMNDCVALIGFSFGGVILRRCFELLNKIKNKIILISVPEKIDLSLREQLTKIIVYAEQEQAELAMQAYSQSVFFTSQPILATIHPQERLIICKRLSIGLQAVLDVNNHVHLINSSIKYLSLVGENSTLVNINHIAPSAKGRCVIVPNAGMRVLQDNSVFCQSVIMEELNASE